MQIGTDTVVGAVADQETRVPRATIARDSRVPELMLNDSTFFDSSRSPRDGGQRASMAVELPR
jgi:hypothetical protein